MNSTNREHWQWIPACSWYREENETTPRQKSISSVSGVTRPGPARSKCLRPLLTQSAPELAIKSGCWPRKKLENSHIRSRKKKNFLRLGGSGGASVVRNLKSTRRRSRREKVAQIVLLLLLFFSMTERRGEFFCCFQVTRVLGAGNLVQCQS